MKLPLAYFGDPILRIKGKHIPIIDDTIQKLANDMIETMEAHNGCGLAAPQVHHSLSLFVTCIPRFLDDESIQPGKVRVFINPKILSYSKEMWICDEGCLSIPGLTECVSRPLEINIQATDLSGQQFEETFTEFDAHVILHENDHVNGVLYIDRLPSKRKKEIEAHLKTIKKKYHNKL